MSSSLSPDAQTPAPETPLPTVRIATSGPRVALGILASVALVFLLEWAQGFVISMLFGILFAYTLNPLVAALERIRIPRVLGATLVIAGVVCALVLVTWSLRGQVQHILDEVPMAAATLTRSLAKLRGNNVSTIQKMQTAATEIEKVTSDAANATAAPPQAATRVVVAPAGFNVSDFLWGGSMGAIRTVGQAAMVVFLTYFLLLSGDSYKRKLVRLTGPTLSDKKVTVHILDDINASIQRYMFMLLATNLLVGVLTWFALRLIGLENAGAWAVFAALLHLIPYLGPGVTAAGIGLMAFLQFGTLAPALLAAGSSLAIATFVGTFVTTWMTGRIASMNTAAVFTALLFWAWLWGVWGMLLSIPITFIVKVVAGHVERFEWVAELLSSRPETTTVPLAGARSTNGQPARPAP